MPETGSLKRAYSEVSNSVSSATPSIESINNTRLGKYELIEIKDRFNKAMMPRVKIIDMKQEDICKTHFSLRKHLKRLNII